MLEKVRSKCGRGHSSQDWNAHIHGIEGSPVYPATVHSNYKCTHSHICKYTLSLATRPDFSLAVQKRS